MRRTFYPGSMLLILPVPPQHIQPGDVIAFRQRTRGDGSSPLVVHRVQTRSEAGFITRGDSNPTCDRQPVLDRDLVGRVAFVLEDGRRRPVRGGLVGHLQATGQRLWQRISPLVGWPYRALRASGVVRRIWRPRIARVEIVTGEKSLIKYIYGQQTVARWWPEDGRFWCRKPYDLVLASPRDCFPKEHTGLNTDRRPASSE